jgi:hypothetical protein
MPVGQPKSICMLTYQKFIERLENSTVQIYIPISFISGTQEWFAIDKTELLRNLRQFADADVGTLPYPCKVQFTPDCGIFIHPKVENR